MLGAGSRCYMRHRVGSGSPKENLLEAINRVEE